MSITNVKHIITNQSRAVGYGTFGRSVRVSEPNVDSVKTVVIPSKGRKED